MNRIRQDKLPGAIGAQGERVVNTGLRTGFALKTGVAALALCLLTGNAWAEQSCARPQEMRALQTAALQQRLMVAAFACHDAAAYNRFVISHRRELQESDRALMSFFVRQNAQKGNDDYNAYKTGLANASSLHSVRDPRFCRSAKAAFDDEFKHRMSLAELVSQRSSLIKTGYAGCTPDGQDTIRTADATPGLSARHHAFPDDQPSDLDPNLTSRLDRALPPLHRDEGVVMPPRGNSRYARPNPARDGQDDDSRNAYAPDGDVDDQGDFSVDGADGQDDPDFGDDAPRYAPEYADGTPPRAYDRSSDRGGRTFSGDTGGNVEDRDRYDDGPTANNAPDADRYADGGPYADRPYADRRYAYPPPVRPRFVRGPDGRWYRLRRRY